ncbi:mCG146549, partial [Mus musculus]
GLQQQQTYFGEGNPGGGVT